MTDVTEHRVATKKSGAAPETAPRSTPAEARPKLEPRIEDVQLCVANVERLLYDSKRVSEPTASALLELALEELMKGWILLAHRTDISRDAQHPPRPVTKGGRSLYSLLSELKKIDLLDTFYRHKPKLDALRHVHRFIAESFQFARPEDFSGSGKILAGGISQDALLSEDALSRARKLLKTLNADEVIRLTELKESGFYVCLSKRGQLVSPDSALFADSAILATYDRAALAILKGIVKAVTTDVA